MTENFKTLEEVKMEYAQQVWLKTKNKVKAAKILGINRNTLARLLSSLKKEGMGSL